MGEAVLRDRVIPLQRSEIKREKRGCGEGGIQGVLKLISIVCTMLNSFSIVLLIDNLRENK